VEQYLRSATLIASTSTGDGIDLTALRVKFAIRKSEVQTPNSAEIRVYNLSDTTKAQFKNAYARIVLQAGYVGNAGVIFDGTIKQVNAGQDGADTHLDIYAGDGDVPYNTALINTTIGAGATYKSQIDDICRASGLPQGYVSDLQDRPLPRGKVYYGLARDALRQVSASASGVWSIQDGRVQIVKSEEVLPNSAVVLNARTGLIGQAEQTNEGVKIQCLLNPQLRVGGVIQIDNSSIDLAKLIQAKDATKVDKPAQLAADGLYKILMLDYIGDTRGQDWYAKLTCSAFNG
jgi:hypothetical protein